MKKIIIHSLFAFAGIFLILAIAQHKHYATLPIPTEILLSITFGIISIRLQLQYLWKMPMKIGIGPKSLPTDPKPERLLYLGLGYILFLISLSLVIRNGV